jgi:hypothetical protein
MAGEEKQVIRYTVEIDTSSGKKALEALLGGGGAAPGPGAGIAPAGGGGGGASTSEALKNQDAIARIADNTGKILAALQGGAGGGSGGGGAGGGGAPGQPMRPPSEGEKAVMQSFTDSALRVAAVVRTGASIGSAVVGYQGSMLSAGQSGIMSGGFLSQQASESAARAGLVGGVGSAIGGGAGALIGSVGGPIGMAVGAAIGDAVGGIPGQIMGIGAKLDSISANTYAFASGLERFSGTILAANLHQQASAEKSQMLAAQITERAFGQLEPLQSKAGRFAAVEAAVQTNRELEATLEKFKNGSTTWTGRSRVDQAREDASMEFAKSITGESMAARILQSVTGDKSKTDAISELISAMSRAKASDIEGTFNRESTRLRPFMGGALSKGDREAVFLAAKQLREAEEEVISGQADLAKMVLFGQRRVDGSTGQEWQGGFGPAIDRSGRMPDKAAQARRAAAGGAHPGAPMPAQKTPPEANNAEVAKEVADAALGLYAKKPGVYADQHFFNTVTGAAGIPKPQPAAINFNISDYTNLQLSDEDAIRTELAARTNQLMDKVRGAADINWVMRNRTQTSHFSKIH